MREKNRFEQYARYLANENNTNEDKSLEALLSQDKKYLEELKALSGYWNLVQQKSNSKHRVVKKTFAKLGLNQPRKIGSVFIRYAAAIALLLSVAVNIYLGQRTNDSLEMVEAQTASGEVEEIKLPDGSTVWLNSMSTIFYPKGLQGKQRNVFLDGEAFFEVAKDARKPFIVHTSEMQVEVLGTRFNVSSYNNDGYTSASLEEGRVKVYNAKNDVDFVELVPGQKALLAEGQEKLLRSVCNTKDISAWKEGRIRFYNTSLPQIAKKLERKFGATIILMDPEMEKLRYTADFEDESLGEILSLLNIAYDFQVYKNGNRYILSTLKEQQ